MTGTCLREDRWRVRRYVVPVPKQAAVTRPWQLQSPVPAPPPTHTVAVWGIWPPQWVSDGPPMLMYPVWHMAFRAAWDRAQFASSPAPVRQSEFKETLPYG
jgi:hypothetical protein